MRSSGETKVNITEEWDCRDWYAGNKSTHTENNTSNTNPSQKTRKKNMFHHVELYFAK